jgi:hypothetical protein
MQLVHATKKKLNRDGCKLRFGVCFVLEIRGLYIKLVCYSVSRLRIIHSQQCMSLHME